MKKNILFIFLSAFILFLACAPDAKNPHDKYVPPKTFREIPSITAEEIAAIEKIQKNDKTYIYALNESSESFLKDDGTYGGFGKYFTDFLSSVFGIKIKIELMEWGRLVEGLATKEISFSGELTNTPERLKKYYMTSDIAVRSIKIFANRNSKNINDIALERKPRYAFLRGTVTGPDVKKASPFPFDDFYTESYVEAVEWLKAGKVDAFLEEASAEAVFDDYDFIKSADYFPMILSPVSLSTEDKDLRPIITATEKFLKSGGIHYLTALYNKGYSDYRKYALLKKFNADERAFVSSAKKVRIALESDNYPISFYNEIDGEFQGIAVDILKEITGLTGIEFETVNEKNDAMPKLMEMLESGRAEMISELIYTDSRKDGFIFSDIYSYTRLTLISRINQREISINEILYSDIGIVQESVHAAIFNAWFPNIDTLYIFNSYDSAFGLLENGEIDFLMADENVLLGRTNYYENSSFKNNIIFDYRLNSTFGFNKNNAVLRDVINKTLPYTNYEELSDKWKNKVFDYSTKIIKNQRTHLLIIAGIMSAVTVIFIIMLIKNRKLSKNLESLVHARTSQLEMKTSLLSSILSAIPDLVFYKDINSVYTGCNHSFEKLTGIKEEELIGKTDKEVFKVDEKMAEEFTDADRRILSSNKTEIVEEIVSYPNGEKRIFETIKTLLKIQEKTAGIMGISRDITERKAIEEAVLVAAKAKGDFLARMSHEIRTPLNAIIGMSNIAKNNIENKEKALSSINESLTASHHLLDILNNILDMSKIESGKLEIVNAPFNISKSFSEISNIIIQKCGEKNIKFTTNVGSFADISVIGDKLRLNQVLINLLGNAVKFTEREGEIFFLAETISENDDSIIINFAVRDNGIGMNDIQMKKLFTAFEQADKTIASRFGGTGLGLAISQSLITMMGSTIFVESSPDKGSTFSFALQFKKNKDADTRVSDEQIKKYDFSGKQILIVEDIEINRIILKEILLPTNVKTEEAVNGEEAVKKFDSSPEGYYDFIFMDVQMPVMNGYEATENIRALKHKDAKTVPIIAMTANAYREDIEDALKSGMNDHIAKPVDISVIMKILDKYLS